LCKIGDPHAVRRSPALSPHSSRSGSAASVVDGLTLALVFLALYAALIGYVYGRRGRWLGGGGWVLLMGGLLLAFSGGGELFPWAGLFWATLAGFGGLMIVMELVERRRR
jgi:hypothetical protein